MDNDKKEKLLLEYLISSSDTFALCQGILKPSYFHIEFRNTVEFIKDYYYKYNATPNPDQIKVETGISLKEHDVKNDQIAYCSSEIEQFCKRRALETAILESVELVNSGEFGKVDSLVRDAVTVSLNKNLGLRYFDDPEGRLNELLNADPVESTGWTEVDEKLFGGIARKEMILFAGGSGSGKSLTLSNLGFNFLERGLNVLYISLELSEEIVAQRFDTMYTGISRRDWKSHVSEISTRVKVASEGKGTLDIVRMPSGSTVNDYRAYLKDYFLHYNMMPDLLVVDYLDKMNPNERIDLSDVWTKDKLCSEQLRDLGNFYNMFIATASQLNRSAVGATHQDHSQIAGGISKINETDVYISINAPDTMKAVGEIEYIFLKTRNSDGVGQRVKMKWDNKTLRITDRDDINQGIVFNKKPSPQEDTGRSGSLLDLMTSTS